MYEGINKEMSHRNVPPAEIGIQVFDLKGNGAAYVTRTRDPVITNDVLYQLS